MGTLKYDDISDVSFSSYLVWFFYIYFISQNFFYIFLDGIG